MIEGATEKTRWYCVKTDNFRYCKGEPDWEKTPDAAYVKWGEDEYQFRSHYSGTCKRDQNKCNKCEVK